MTTALTGASGMVGRWSSFLRRALAPLSLQLRRAARGDYWVESTEERQSSGPTVDMEETEDSQGPDDGVGPLHHRRYEVRIRHATRDAAQLVDAFRRDPNRFSPTSFAVFEPEPGQGGLVEGDEIEVKLPGPWNGPVRVAQVAPSLLRLETLDGHMEAGRIEFSANDDGEVIVFAIDSLATSGDIAFHWLYDRLRIGKQFQSEMWAQVLEAAVQESGGRQQGRLQFSTVTYLGADS